MRRLRIRLNQLIERLKAKHVRTNELRELYRTYIINQTTLENGGTI